MNATVPRLWRPDVSGSRPDCTARANSVSVAAGPVLAIGRSAAVRALPPRGRIITRSSFISSSRLVHTTSPRWNSRCHSPAQGVRCPAPRGGAARGRGGGRGAARAARARGGGWGGGRLGAWGRGAAAGASGGAPRGARQVLGGGGRGGVGPVILPVGEVVPKIRRHF